MSSEKPASEILDVKTLSPQTKMRIILEVFDLGKEKIENGERRKKFIELVSRYYRAYIKSGFDVTDKTQREKYEEGRANLHNKIMDVITKMSLSLGLSQEQREVASYLSENRDEVTRMISAYFMNWDPASPKEYSDYQMAHEGMGNFRSVPGKEDD